MDTYIINKLGIDEKYTFALYLLPLSVLFFSLYNSLNYLLIRDKKFFSSSVNKITKRSSEGFFQLSLAYLLSFRSVGLFLGDVLGNFFAFISAFYQNSKQLRIDKRFLNPKLLIHIAKEYSDLPKYNIIPELLNTAFLAAISFLVLAKFDITSVGYMEATQRILAIPSVFIAYSIGQVLLQKTTESINNKKPISKDIIKVFLMLLALSIPFVLMILLYAEPIFGLIFGKGWEISGLYSKYLIIFYALALIVSPLSQVLISLKEFKVNAIWKIGRFFLIFPLFFVDYEKVDNYLINYSILGGLSYVVYFIIVMYYSKKYDKSLL